MQLGFVLDQGACIGCHACTVACKAENDVPLGSFRTWVKWIEKGEFPETQRAAAVLRCNHCSDAPCISICPTGALHKLDNGIVDLDPRSCIGCASCLQACPYDAIYIDDRVGTAAKCHFCAHRIEVQMAPACVSVCPEQAIKVVDMAAPGMLVELAERGATVRKAERGTRPQTSYLGADPATLDPLAVDGTRTLSHAEVPNPLPAPGNTDARAVYDVPRKRQWGSKIAAYMVTKAIASGALLCAAASPWVAPLAAEAQALGWIGVIFTVITAILLVSDLHKPSRFFYVLTRPNTTSWLVKGGWVITAHGALSFLWAVGAGARPGLATGLAVASVPLAILMSIYTAFLFRQARGRELWSEDIWLPAVLAVQSLVSAVAIAGFLGVSVPGGVWAWLLLYPIVMLLSSLWPQPTHQARVAHGLMLRHPAFAVGAVFSLLALVVPVLLFLAFLFFDWVYVRAGQEVALS